MGRIAGKWALERPIGVPTPEHGNDPAGGRFRNSRDFFPPGRRESGLNIRICNAKVNAVPMNQ
jgi:hypothetical protein